MIFHGIEIVPGVVLIGLITDSGTTVPAPEPGSGTLLGIALVSLAAGRRLLMEANFARWIRIGGFGLRADRCVKFRAEILDPRLAPT